MKRGLFITLEGGEGLGKSVQSRLLAEKLREIGQRVILTREPGGTEISERIRDLLLNSSNLSHRAELLLFHAARAQHVDELIRPALEEGQIVICDRYKDSTDAYQGRGRGWHQATLDVLHGIATMSLQPTITFILVGTPHRSLSGDDNLERESEEFHERVRKGFESLAGTADRYVMIDANRPVDVVHTEILSHVLRLL